MSLVGERERQRGEEANNREEGTERGNNERGNLQEWRISIE